MKKRNVFGYVGMFFLITYSISMQAQVVIGYNKTSEKFSVLELLSTTGGLRYPQLTQSQKDALSLTSNPLAGGLIVFNKDNAGNLEYYNGNSWTVVYTPFVIRSIRQLGRDQGVSITGTQSISVPVTASEVASQTYHIQLPGTILADISKLKVGKYLDFDNVVQSVTLNNTSIISTDNIFTVTFRQRAVDLIKQSSEPIRFTLYATYEDNGIAKEVDFEVTLQRE
ncbi:MAG: hypothetical protein LBP83_00875 [Dysgonamonadaceae bacterium]|jgi:hypothetical protein|nr:hypothetical protein [Dysgonamonadaceae bacterium]